MEDVLKVSHLNVYYKQYAKSLFKKPTVFHAVKDVSFSVGEGEILGLLGESGCGKSTVAKAVLGMLPQVDGTIEHFSKNPQMVFQDPFHSLNPARSVGQILKEPLRNLTDLSKEAQEEKAVSMIKRVGLDEKYLSHYPKELSGGQRQRVAIAAALMLEPKLLIADEPVSALDVTIQAQIIDLMLKLRDEMKLSMIFISHDLRVVYQMCDRIVIMKEGILVEEGRVEDVYANPSHPYTKTLIEAANLKV